MSLSPTHTNIAKEAFEAGTENQYHHPTCELIWQSLHDPRVWYSAHAPDPQQPVWSTLMMFERDG